jgi:putative transposase
VSETYIEVGALWMSLHCAIDSTGDTVAFWFRERRNLAAKRFLAHPLKRHGRRAPLVINGSRTSREANLSCDTTDQFQDGSRRNLKPVRISQTVYLINSIEQDHLRIKQRVRALLVSGP